MTAQEYTNTNYREYLKSEHWRNLVEERRQIDGGRCQMCGSTGTTGNPLECHHWGYQHLWHEDVYTELVTVCHCCHKQIHRLLMRPTSKDGTNNRVKNPMVPTVHIYTVSGQEIENKLDDLTQKEPL